VFAHHGGAGATDIDRVEAWHTFIMRCPMVIFRKKRLRLIARVCPGTGAGETGLHSQEAKAESLEEDGSRQGGRRTG